MAAVETLKKITSPLKRPERLCQKTAVDCYDFSNNKNIDIILYNMTPL